MSYILFVEDDIPLAQAVEQILIENGYQIDCTYDGDDGFQKASLGIYDIVILDIMLPGKHGYAIAKELREAGNNVPILMLTARSTVQDKVAGFDCGADDYMTKPFSPAELLAHLRAIERRAMAGSSGIEEMTAGDLTLNLNSHDLSANGKKVTLSVKEFELVKMLMAEPGKVFSKESMLAKVWGTDSAAADNNVEAYISFIRKKLKYLGSTTQLETLRKVGYRLAIAE